MRASGLGWARLGRAGLGSLGRAGTHKVVQRGGRGVKIKSLDIKSVEIKSFANYPGHRLSRNNEDRLYKSFY